MAYQTWMADVLRSAGLPVREVAGWRTRGHGSMGAVVGVLAHHTAGGATGLYPSERVVVEGRAGLAGPLCNLGLDRAGTWIVVAAGQAYHAGTGSAPWCPAGQGNSRLLGVEAESVGTRDDWSAAQRSSYPRGVAALLRHLGLPASRAIGHKEWAPGRKIDPAFWDMNAFRAAVAHWQGLPVSSVQAEEFLMPLSDTDLARIRDAVWQGPIDDLIYGGTTQAWQHLQRANANTDSAGRTADELRGAVERLAAEVKSLAVQGGGLPAAVSGLDAAALRALAVAVVDEQGRRLTPPAP